MFSDSGEGEVLGSSKMGAPAGISTILSDVIREKLSLPVAVEIPVSVLGLKSNG